MTDVLDISATYAGKLMVCNTKYVSWKSKLQFKKNFFSSWRQNVHRHLSYMNLKLIK